MQPSVTKNVVRQLAGSASIFVVPSVCSRHMTRDERVFFCFLIWPKIPPEQSRGSSRWGQKSLFFAAHLPSGGRRIRILNFWYKWDFFSLSLCSADSPPFFAVGGGRNIGTTRKATGSLIGSTHTEATPGPTFGVLAADSAPLDSLARLATAEVTAKSSRPRTQSKWAALLFSHPPGRQVAT
jgi:hypothetical protein